MGLMLQKGHILHNCKARYGGTVGWAECYERVIFYTIVKLDMGILWDGLNVTKGHYSKQVSSQPTRRLSEIEMSENE